MSREPIVVHGTLCAYCHRPVDRSRPDVLSVSLGRASGPPTPVFGFHAHLSCLEAGLPMPTAQDVARHFGSQPGQLAIEPGDTMDEHSDVYFPGAGIWQALREGRISTAEAAEQLAALRDLMIASLGIPFPDAQIPTEADLVELRQFVPDTQVSDMLEVLRLLRESRRPA